MSPEHIHNNINQHVRGLQGVQSETVSDPDSDELKTSLNLFTFLGSFLFPPYSESNHIKSNQFDPYSRKSQSRGLSGHRLYSERHPLSLDPRSEEKLAILGKMTFLQGEKQM